MCQSVPRRAPNMLRLVFLVLLSRHTPAYVTDSPSFADRLDKLYEKLERFTLAPASPQLEPSPEDLLAKIDRLNALGPDKELSDEDEEMLSTMQMWGMISPEQLEGVVKELQGMKEERSEKLTDGEYSDGEWVDEDLQEIDYANDIPPEDGTGWEDLDADSSTSKPVVTPSAFTKHDNRNEIRDYRNEIRDNSLADAGYSLVSAVDPIAATKERPRILDDSTLTVQERTAYRTAALEHIRTVVKTSKCLTPQPRWLPVAQMAPAADTVYMPPCVQLHRCAHDTGCCYKEEEVCAPVDGKYVTVPFYLNKADGNISVARMLFFNHTRCACVSRETLHSSVTRVEPRHSTTIRRESIVRETKQAREPRAQTEEKDEQIEWKPTEEPKYQPRDEVPTAPPQLRRCTCPGLFLAKMGDNGVCACVCDWPDLIKRRDCLSLARGREHFGLRDRVCIVNGDCNPPTCEYGAYERGHGRCPLRRFHRLRFRRGRLDKIVV